MKKTNLQEELKRIHEITYGSSTVNEQFMSKLLNKLGVGGKKVDDPKKADLVSDDITDFYKTIEDSIESGGFTQQSKGGYEFQKGVESMQIGLILLGYELPKYGVDGLFGPETANAVRRFKNDNLKQSVNETANMLRDTLDDLGYKEKGSELTSGGDVNNNITSIVSQILKKYKETNPNVVVTVTAGNDNFHKKVGYKSSHSTGNAIDITISPYNSKNASDFIKILNNTKNQNSGFNFIDEYTNPSKASTGGHFHLQYGGKSTNSGGSIETATPEMLSKLLELLKSRNLKSDDLKKYIDPVISITGATDENVYQKILESLGAPTSEENMKFMIAWRQAEGSGGKYNPFNTTQNMPGAVSINSHGVKSYLTLEDGIVATIKTLRNGRYNCIINGLVNDIGAENIAKCESLKTWGTGNLVSKVIDGYNRGASPKIKSIA
jgi:peptidoglycan hydrolase-like protein with peptidoglycan-binding domain